MQLEAGLHRLNLQAADELTSITPSGLAPCCILYMVDAIANVSTPLNLEIECVQDTDSEKIKRIIAVKPRAGYAPIISEFALSERGDSSSVPHSVRYIENQTAIFRKAANIDDRRLFIGCGAASSLSS
ncbi:hypothetical protein J8I87_27460 [Paraburkholderia sp. LEh10]|uniref:hypothetical protein n=1 Tax=Paraburkholderia sp. LEh10 TaxID=2821353 RepID=UPI001AE9D2B3|nr:hypothetical protein [Paraburkholderia sp. LEh10]MBP0593370.1 hypothetical protein [Paraburkholderia sp. LEh10]